MTFKLRRVTSGLLPQQHISGTEPNGSSITFGREKIFDLAISRTVSDHDHTSNGAFKESHPTQSEQPSFPRFSSSKTVGSASFGAKRSHLQQPDGSGRKFYPNLDARTFDREADFIRQNKLITDDNIFSPQSTAGRGMRTSTFQDSMAANGLEFDPSDRELPVKVADVNLSTRPLPKNDLLVPKVHGPTNTAKRDQTHTELEHPIAPTHTPRRSSPLRQVHSKDSANTTTEDVVNALSESSALRPKTTKEIFDQINSSIERFRVYENEKRNTYSSLDESDVSNEEGLYKSLDSILPRRDTKTKNLIQGDKKSDQRESSVLELGSPVRGKKFKTFARYSAKNIKKPSILKANKRESKFKPWTAERWKMLEALVLLSIPNSVIIHSKMVQSRLSCDSQKELAQRVQFLQKRMKK